MKERAVIFITDAGFLLPTMVAALQVAGQQEVMRQADILILLYQFEPAQAAEIRETFADRPLTFIDVPASFGEIDDDVHFNDTGVPRSTLVRLSIGPLIPPQYEHITYLDGDIQVVGDIAPLVAHTVAEGHIAAANDTLWLARNDAGPNCRRMRSYVTNLGTTPDDYFNAGVLAFRRATWQQVAPRAKAFFLADSRLCEFHDQSALNAMFAGRTEILSPVFNLISGYADLGLQDMASPRIIHFTGRAKPWFFDGPPWSGRFRRSYEDLVQRYPMMARYHVKPDAAHVAVLEAAQRRHRLLSMLRTPWRHFLRRRRIRAYLAMQHFAVG